MYQEMKKEAKFEQEINDFTAMLNNDLEKRVSETTKKFSFDFFAEAPMKDADSPFTWQET